MSKIDDLQAQIASLQAQVAQVKKDEQKDAIATCKKLIADFELTEKQLFSKRGAKKSASKAAAMYRDPTSGKTWSGKGRMPLWMVGKNREDFVI